MCICVCACVWWRFTKDVLLCVGGGGGGGRGRGEWWWSRLGILFIFFEDDKPEKLVVGYHCILISLVSYCTNLFLYSFSFIDAETPTERELAQFKTIREGYYCKWDTFPIFFISFIGTLFFLSSNSTYRIYCNKRPPYNKRPSPISAPFDTKIII